jgi:hypothetical protein
MPWDEAERVIGRTAHLRVTSSVEALDLSRAHLVALGADLAGVIALLLICRWLFRQRKRPAAAP